MHRKPGWLEQALTKVPRTRPEGRNKSACVLQNAKIFSGMSRRRLGKLGGDGEKDLLKYSL